MKTHLLSKYLRLSLLMILVIHIIQLTASAFTVSASESESVSFFRDDFTESELDPAWTVRDGKGIYSLTESPGHLKLTLANNGEQDWGNTVRISRSFSGEHWVFETKVHYDMSSTGTQQGRQQYLVLTWPGPEIANPSVNWLRDKDCCASPSRDQISTQIALTEGSPDAISLSPNTFDTYYLRIIRDGQTVTLQQRSPVETAFTTVKEHTFSTLGSEQTVLLFATSHSSESSSAEYDYIEVSTLSLDPDTIRVTDETDTPIPDAIVYANGQEIGKTNQAGLLVPNPPLIEGAQLVALAQQPAEQSTHRDTHDGWAYRTYLTSLSWQNDSPAPFIVSEGVERRLVVRKERPLVLFNLVVSIEWDADEAYMQEIERAVRRASDYIYDLTDGQMAFQQVAIYDNGKNWANADIQIFTKNTVHPHAYISGITSSDRSHVIRLGRGWDGNSGNQGPWDQPAGYRTLAHEFGHYAFHLYDEYFAYIFDGNGNLAGETTAYCPMPYQDLPENDTISASAMYYQYGTTEFSAQNILGMWSDACKHTAQYQLNSGESAWETLARTYADTASPPRWELVTPLKTGNVLAGPVDLPSGLPDWPVVASHPEGNSAPPRHLTVYDPQGQPYGGAIVALYKDTKVIGQGLTDHNGTLNIYGVAEGDKIRASSFDSGLHGIHTVSAEELTLSLTPVRSSARRTIRAAESQTVETVPYLYTQITANPNSTSSDQIDLFISVYNFENSAAPEILVTEPGSTSGHAPLLNYSSITGSYEGQITFSATERGMGRIRVIGGIHGNTINLHSTYRLQKVSKDRVHDVYSNDGNLHLHLEPNSFPASEAYFVVMPIGAVPGPLPEGLTLVGDPYNISLSGAVAALEKPGILTLRYDTAVVNQVVTPSNLKIYRWEADGNGGGHWRPVAGELDQEHKTIAASLKPLGIYALLAKSAAVVQAGSGTVNQGDSYTIPIKVLDVPPVGIGATTVEVVYDKSALAATDCHIVTEKGECNHNEPGIVRFSWLSTAGVMDDQTLASITFQVTGQAGHRSPLDVTVEIMTDPDGNPVPFSDLDGEIVIVDGQVSQPGDVNCDDVSDALDALLVLKHTVNLTGANNTCPSQSPPEWIFEPQCDVNTDARCNVIDALLIMQCDVGISNVFCPVGSTRAAMVSVDHAHSKPRNDGQSTKAGIDIVSTVLQERTTLTLMAREASANGLGAATVEINYNPLVFKSPSCITDPKNLFDAGFCNVDFERSEADFGIIRFNLASATGVTGDFPLAEITFQAIEQGAKESDLEVIFLTGADSNGSPLRLAIDAELNNSSEITCSQCQVYLPLMQR